MFVLTLSAVNLYRVFEHSDRVNKYVYLDGCLGKNINEGVNRVSDAYKWAGFELVVTCLYLDRLVWSLI